jgi:hypothetical protein
VLYAIITDRWISGVFEREIDARNYLQELPEGIRSAHVLRQLDNLHYPSFLVEDSEGFRFMTEEAALDDISRHAPMANEDECCVTLYRFDHDYRPRVSRRG